ncbi:FAD/NAD(P)-binding protein [candidate division WOR-3 bacterium]|nr:FAD/NAD(P)-binding protein [candidate division WOR-3 bacterium]
MQVKEIATETYKMQRARIVSFTDLSRDVRFLQIRPSEITRACETEYKPGQFMMISIPGVGEGPFSISSTPSRPGLIEFGIRKVGALTQKLHELRENSFIWLRGPYGNGFPIYDMEAHNLIIVMGGLGAIPLRSLLLYALDNRENYKKIYLLYGAKTPDEMLFREEYLAMKNRDDVEVLLTVDRDPSGIWSENKGVVTELFSKIEGIDPEETYVAVVGPPVMYKFVLKELLKMDIPKHQILMSLERRMRCGVGKCGHCAIGYIYTCIDGPVFTYWDVMHIKEKLV